MLFRINTERINYLRKIMGVPVFSFYRHANMSFFLLIGIALFVCSCDQSYNEKLKGTWDGIEGMRKQSSPYVRWRVEESARILENENKNRIKKGIIVFAHYGRIQTSNGTNFNQLAIYYLCGHAAIRQVRLLKAGKAFLCMSPNFWMTACAKEIEGETLQYAQEFIWPESEDPLAVADVTDLSVELVKQDGSVIGPAGIMANIDLKKKVEAFVYKEGNREEIHEHVTNKVLRSENK